MSAQNDARQVVLCQLAEELVRNPVQFGKHCKPFAERGLSNYAIADLFGCSEKRIRTALSAIDYVRPSGRLIVPPSIAGEDQLNFSILDAPHLEGDNWAIFSDIHLPLTNYELLDQATRQAKELGIKRLIIPGDLLHMDALNRHEWKQSGADLPLEMNEANRVIKDFLKVFDEIVICLGNHDENWQRALQGRMRFSEALRSFLWKVSEEDHRRIKIADGDHVILHTCEGKWRVCHTRSYSKQCLAYPCQLTTTFRCHVWAGHRHHHGVGVGPQGEWAVEAGCFNDPDKVEYKHRFTNTYPEWAQGYGFIINGKPYLPLLNPAPKVLIAGGLA